MKRTKNMIYNPSIEANELYIFAVNDSKIYNNYIKYAIENLRKKALKGVYNSEKAIDLYYHIATEASNKYNIDYGYNFNVQDRFTCAVDFEKRFYEDVFEGLEA